MIYNDCIEKSIFKKVVEGHPTFIVFQGKVNQKKMAALKYSVDDLCHHLREQGIGSISEVEFAVLETDGQLSVIESKKVKLKHQVLLLVMVSLIKIYFN
ncbi:YetF domain-containing protein [Allocoprobacillus halotolerans]|uniref:YetF domain-containing protein n=1 Tax=Allocoprobacillus halotolerans TaxID=2944914 RepID=UPI00338D44BF